MSTKREIWLWYFNINEYLLLICTCRSHYKILKVMNLIFTGCIVPPATTTALASLTMLVKCTAGFNRRNFKLEQLSRPVERCMYMYNDFYDTGIHVFNPSRRKDKMWKHTLLVTEISSSAYNYFYVIHSSGLVADSIFVRTHS